MRAVTGLPIKFLGMGERAEALEPFDARRIAGRILGQGDIVGLVEKAVENVDRDEAEKMAKKMAKGRFDFDDMEKQLGQVLQIGGLKGVMGMLPGVQKMKSQISDASLDDKQIHHQIAIIRSMTKAERAKPDLLNGRRRARIAKGAGLEVAAVNRLVKMHRNMADMAKRMGKGKMPLGMPGMGPGGGMPSPEALKQLGAGAPLPGLNPQSGLPGLPGSLPGLPGSNKKS
jgi:signal recognition particle subunit SRP54